MLYRSLFLHGGLLSRASLLTCTATYNKFKGAIFKSVKLFHKARQHGINATYHKQRFTDSDAH